MCGGEEGLSPVPGWVSVHESRAAQTAGGDDMTAREGKREDL